ncbi:MAG: ASCH domain-containing protein [Treponema sp.]|nr:ASCH domain-containing protein [Treponema sp.]
MKDPKTLHLVLKHKWWDMIERGEKKEEYRAFTEYWTKRILVLTKQGQLKVHFFRHLDEKEIVEYKDFDAICFHKGYTNTTLTFENEGIEINYGREEWGAEPDKLYFVIKLGKRI